MATLSHPVSHPLALPPNQPPRFYRGGAAIASLRGLPQSEEWGPEDWVGSTTTLFGQAESGLSHLLDGRRLRDAIAADPEGFLGAEHAEHFGADPAMLVKLLDAAERLPVHCHPGRDFARSHLDCPYGKTEAWIVVATTGPDPVVYLGFAETAAESTVARWVDDQDPALLSTLNAISVSPGDAILVPAGVPHAIGAGVFVTELQEPTDLSVMLEWEGFPLDGPTEGHLGLGYDRALECVDRSGWSAERLDHLRTSRPDVPAERVARAFPHAADPYFRAERLRPAGGSADPEPGFSVLVTLDGHGQLDTEQGDRVDLPRGSTVLLPYAAGRTRLRGDCEAIRCRPPRPADT